MEKELTSATTLSFLDNLHEGILVVATDGTIQYLNQAAIELLGLEREPATLYEAVAPYEAWQELLEGDSETHLYTNAGRVGVQARTTTWQNTPAVQLVLTPAHAVEDSQGRGQLDDRLAALTRISQQLSATLRLDAILQAVVEEATANTGATGGHVSLYNKAQEQFAMRLVRGDAVPPELLAGLEKEVLESRQGLIRHRLPKKFKTRSLLIVPIVYEGLVAGMIVLYSSQPDYFDEEERLFVVALANHAAIAIGNAQRFDELNKRSTLLHRRAQQIERFVESSRVMHDDRPLSEVYDDLVYAIQEGVGFHIVVLNLIDEDAPAMPLRTIAAAGLPLERFQEIQQMVQPWAEIEKVLVPEFALGRAYFVPAERADAYANLQTFQASDLYPVKVLVDQRGESTYHVVFVADDDVLNVRTRPGTAHQVISALPHDARQIYITGSAQAVDGSFWVPIIYRDIAGWVNERYLQEDPLPIQNWDPNDLFVIPLLGSRGQPIGLISLDSPVDGHRPDINTAKALEIFANQAATAIENIRLYHNTRAYANQLQQLHNISQQVLRELDFDRQLQLIVESIQAAGWDRSTLTLRDRELNVVKLVAAGLTEEEVRFLKDNLLPAETWRERLTDERYSHYRVGACYFMPADDPWVQERVGLGLPDNSPVRAEPYAWHPDDLLFLPLYDREQHVMAIISLDHPQDGRRPTLRSVQIIELYAQMATPIIENSQLYQEMQHQLADLRTVTEVGRAISTILDLEELLEQIGRAISAAYQVDSYYISLYNTTDNTLHFPVLVERMASQDVSPIQAERGPTNYVFRTGQPLLVSNKSEWDKHTDPGYGEPSESYLAVPMRAADRVIGVIAIQDYSRPNLFGDHHIRTLTTIASQAAVAIENARLLSETLARSQELRILFEASHAISGTLDQEIVLTAMGDYLLQVVNAQGYTIYEWNRAKREAVVVAEHARLAQRDLTPASAVYNLADFKVIQQVIDTQVPLVAQVDGQTVTLPKRPAWLPEGETTFTAALLPIIIRDEIYGVVEITAPAGRHTFNENELQSLLAIINQAGIAMENAQLFEDTYQRERFFAALGRVSLAINATFDLPTVLSLICQESLSLFQVDGAYIWQRQEDELVGIAAQGHASEEFSGLRIPATDISTFAATVVHQGEGTFINNFRQQSAVNLHLPQQESIQAVLGIPLMQEADIIGALILVERSRPDRFGPRDMEQATVFGVQAAIAIQNAQLVTELRELNEQLDERVAERTRALGQERDRVQYLLRITTELSASLDQDRVLSQALELVNEVVNATQGGILLMDSDTGNLVYRAAFGRPERLPAQGAVLDLSLDRGLAGSIIHNRTAVVINDTQADERWVSPPDNPEHRSVLAVPLISSDEVIGVLMLFHKEPGAFTQQQLELVEAATIQVANAINNAQLYLLIRDQAERLGTMLRLEQIEAAKNQAIVESIADGVLVADAAGQVILANMPASLILDIPRRQLIGKSINELLGLYGSSGESWMRTIDRWGRHADGSHEYRASLADRLTVEDKVVSVHLSPVFANNQFFGTVSIFRDITKEVEVDRMKSEFVSTVSHELRTPMTSIKGYADLMLMGAAGLMTDPQLRYLKVIKNNADRLSMLVNDLLDISRIETGKTELDLRPLDIPQVIEQVVEGHLRGRIEHEGKPIKVFTEMAPSLPLVHADHARITQVLTNLLDNAFHYTPAEGEIKVRVVSNGNYVVISITDTGIGISKENQKKIFDRFFRAEDAEVQRVAGTGLGLSIVRSLIEMHGGRIEVESTLGKGSTFTFSLPLVPEESDVV
ncbi:MAG: GAF domain-containing protein [Chloroflexi bacterium]|nr:GAF domain-containing protein [Chloroflexota bacterium]MCI0650201.1 GAF domain-containing protein [Chloroflexota bacterium]MCI0729488.1 GAF domain-containing protein [Chloroflexota bacterium]